MNKPSIQSQLITYGLLFMQCQKATGNQNAGSASSGERSKFIHDWFSVIRSIGPSFVCCIDFVEEKHVKIVVVGQLLKHLIILLFHFVLLKFRKRQLLIKWIPPTCPL